MAPPNTSAFITYVDVDPDDLTYDQIIQLRRVKVNVRGIYATLTDAAWAIYKTKTEPVDEADQAFLMSQILIDVLSSAPKYLAIIGQGVQTSDLKVKNENFHADIIRLAAGGITLSDSMVAGLEQFIQLITDSFAMGGSQTHRNTRWVVGTLFYWDRAARQFDVQLRLSSFDITTEMEEIVKQGKTDIPGDTTLKMSFSTKDWEFVDPNSTLAIAPAVNVKSAIPEVQHIVITYDQKTNFTKLLKART